MTTKNSKRTASSTSTKKSKKKESIETYLSSEEILDKNIDFINPRLKVDRKYKLTQKQQAFLEVGLTDESRVLMIDGLWGTGKTSLSVYTALQLLNNDKIDRILYLRNPVESTDVGKMGYLKGTAEEKLSPYGEVFFGLLEEFLSISDIKKVVERKIVEVNSIGFIRGLNWSRMAIIVDESANFSKDQLMLIMSRIKDDSKIFIVGDSLMQNDIGKRSGFAKVFDYFKGNEKSKEFGVHCFEFKSDEDIVRSKFLRYIMSCFKDIK